MAQRLLCLLLCLAMLGGLLPPPAAALISLEEERKLGEEAYDQVMASIPLVDDPDIVDYVRGLAKRLEAYVPDKPFPFHIYVADVGVMNAFAIPGGYIFMYRGMITTLESEAELAGVLAHEMGHVWRRHLAHRMEKSTPTNIATLAGLLAGIILGGAVSPALGQAVTMGSVAGGVQQQLAFSREDEQEADWAAFKTMTAAGYPPQEMERSFQRIWKMENYMGGNTPVYLRTHPTGPQRMEAMANMARTWQGKALHYDNSEFLRIQTRLIALYDPEPQAEKVLNNRRLSDPNSPYPIYGLGLLNMRRHRYESALQFLERLGQLWPNNIYQIRAQGICLLMMGQDAKAEALLKRSMEMKPGDTDTMLALGQAYQRQGRLNDSAEVLRKLVAKDPENHAALYELGVSLGRLGQVGEASLYLGLAFIQRQNYRSAQYHLNRAVKNLADKPELQAKAQKALEQMDDRARHKQKRQAKEEEQRHNQYLRYEADQGRSVLPLIPAHPSGR
ncbi:MAG: M48 family metalloprotease [Desulfarculus sp.]|nr:M48 family metalloprotease [Pseudomonadota bacterium]MBU4599308.1 M48 family metalloprotease [Pseudomonadota bacterium]MBV1714473.1 M48 family metalloprotease [Desulfarculus sp.]MBV1737159.1 M48 family metalloprotease [Desulfarculus sp.]MBV1751543.1 M48 family metalloprotease [Desulfarculus sp.]